MTYQIYRKIKSKSFRIFQGNPYREDVTRWLFDKWLMEITQAIINSRRLAIVDAAFLRYHERKNMANLANEKRIRFIIITCECADIIAKQRIEKRSNSMSKICSFNHSESG